MHRLQRGRPADRRQGCAQRRENCVPLLLHPLLFGPRFWGRPQLQHRVPQFPEVRKYKLQREDDGLESGPVKVFFDRERDRQQRTESQSEEAQHCQ